MDKTKRSRVAVIAMCVHNGNRVFDSLCSAAEYFRNMNFKITPMQIQRKIEDGSPAIFKEKFYGPDGKARIEGVYEWFFDELFE